jgi:pimeloyl-ACP methyl ester carboxylesterase
MAIFLMVPGGVHGGWCFDLLAPELATHGHRMLAPDLLGLSSTTRIPARDVSLALWAEQIAGLARLQDEPVILCGHSRGGIVISQAAEYAPEAVSALVYITAILAPSGVSMADMMARLPAETVGGSTVDPDEGVTRYAPEAAMRVFYSSTPEALARDAAARLVPEPIRPLTEPLRLSDARFGRVPRYYIECTEDRAMPLAFQRALQAELPCRAITLESDHSPFLCCPATLAAALHGISEEARPAAL